MICPNCGHEFKIKREVLDVAIYEEQYNNILMNFPIHVRTEIEKIITTFSKLRRRKELHPRVKVRLLQAFRSCSNDEVLQAIKRYYDGKHWMKQKRERYFLGILRNVVTDSTRKAKIKKVMEAKTLGSLPLFDTSPYEELERRKKVHNVGE